MNQTKRLLLTFLLAGVSSFALADDEWIADRLDNGEAGYKSGHYDNIYIGAKGVGFSTRETVYDEDSVFVIVDEGNPIQSQLTIFGHIYLFKNSKMLAPLMLTAKKVEIRFSSCGTSYAGMPWACMLSKAGWKPYSVKWEFQRPLADILAKQ